MGERHGFGATRSRTPHIQITVRCHERIVYHLFVSSHRSIDHVRTRETRFDIRTLTAIKYSVTYLYYR